MEKSNMVVCYCTTSNRYPYVCKSIRSLLKHNDPKHVYVFVNDDNFEFPDDRVSSINVSGQTYISPASKSYNSKWTYMACVRCFFTKYLTEDKAIYLDDDIIVVDDITEMWNADMGCNLISAVAEPHKPPYEIYDDFNEPYVNSGAIVMNLARIKAEAVDNALIYHLNNADLMYPDQDAINFVCKGRITLLPAKFNSCIFTDIVPDAKIIHCTPQKPWDKRSPWHYIWNKL